MKKVFKWLIVFLIALQAIVIVAGVVIFRIPLPDHEVDVSGLPLTDFVEVIRDDRGIPHIYGTDVDQTTISWVQSSVAVMLNPETV